MSDARRNNGRPGRGLAGLSETQLVVLRSLWLLDALPRELAYFAACQVATVRSALTHLARRRLVVRVGRRTRAGQRWRLTQKGQKAIAKTMVRAMYQDFRR